MLRAVLIGWIALGAAKAGATTFHVALGGNDGNPGTFEDPFRTLTKGVSVLAPGDTLYIRGGVYGEPISNPPGGSSWRRGSAI